MTPKVYNECCHVMTLTEYGERMVNGMRLFKGTRTVARNTVADAFFV